jgi:hypothetical protein
LRSGKISAAAAHQSKASILQTNLTSQVGIGTHKSKTFAEEADKSQWEVAGFSEKAMVKDSVLFHFPLIKAQGNHENYTDREWGVDNWV